MALASPMPPAWPTADALCKSYVSSDVLTYSILHRRCLKLRIDVLNFDVFPKSHIKYAARFSEEHGPARDRTENSVSHAAASWQYALYHGRVHLSIASR